jgi:hypothetical protein
MKSRKNKRIKKNTRKYPKIIYLPNKTPKNIDYFSQMIFNEAPKQELPLAESSILLEEPPAGSYSPSVNKDLVSLKSLYTL